MTTTFRTWLAACLLGFSAFVLTLASPAEQLANRALLPMFVVFAIGWMIAVGERATVPRGGLRVPRFPLGPRIMQVRPGLGAQLIALILVLGVVAGPRVAGWAAMITAMVTIHAVRKVAWFAVPAAWVVNTLATMPEFHTLGDLVKDAGDWTRGLVVFGLQALLICGPLLRTDAGGKLTPGARVATLIAALPTWGAAFWVFSRTPAGGQYLDLEALTMVLLAGGLVQSLLLGCFTWLVKVDEREVETLPSVSAHGVGLALMPLLLPILALAGLFLMPLPPDVSFGGTPAAWLGLAVVLLIVPAVLGVGLVGAALDRVDGRARGVTASLVAGGGLAAWFLFGPIVLQEVYAPGGPASQLLATWDTHGGGPPLVAEIIPGSSPLSGHEGGQLALFGLPAADLSRALTLMVFGIAALSARYMRHARLGQKPVDWSFHILLLALAGVAAWVFVPRLGPVGAPLACAGAAALMLGFDLFHAEVRVKTKDELLAEQLEREEAEVQRKRAERAAMAQATPQEIVG